MKPSPSVTARRALRIPMCPPPFDPAARQSVMPAPPGAGRPPVPPSLLTTGPDLTPGPLAGDGLFGAPPAPAVLGRPPAGRGRGGRREPRPVPDAGPTLRAGHPQPRRGVVLRGAVVRGRSRRRHRPSPHRAVRPSSVARRARPALVPGASARVDHRRLHRAAAGRRPHGRLHVARALWETAEALRGEPAFRPRADALAAMAGTALRMVPTDHAGVRFGDQAIVQEWLRRCPPELRVTLLRDTAPGDHFRLACYDLAAAAAALPAAAAGPAEARRVAFALLAADLDAAPGAVAAVLPWLDHEGVRTLQSIGQPAHPLRGAVAGRRHAARRGLRRRPADPAGSAGRVLRDRAVVVPARGRGAAPTRAHRRGGTDEDDRRRAGSGPR